jgi:hypothetical protein
MGYSQIEGHDTEDPPGARGETRDDEKGDEVRGEIFFAINCCFLILWHFSERSTVATRYLVANSATV